MADETPDRDPMDPNPPEDAPKSTDEMLRELLAGRAEDRAELAAMREQLAKAKAAPPRQTAVALSPEELHAQRMEAIKAAKFYCPGCGLLYKRERECTGRPEAPHPAIEVVSTKELQGDDPSKHTEAPGVNP